LYSACDALVLIGPKAGQADPAVIDLLNDHDCEVQRSAPFILAALGPITTNVIPALINALTNDGDWYTEENALRAIGLIGPAATNAIPDLVLELKHFHPDFREFAAEALGNIGPKSKSAIPALLAAERDQNIAVSDAARSALLKIEVVAPAKAP
jgi:HEAT repeat protein